MKKAGEETKLIEIAGTLSRAADDEGNAYGMLAHAFERTKQSDKAARVSRGIEAASSHAIRNGRRIQNDFGKRVLSAVGTKNL